MGPRTKRRLRVLSFAQPPKDAEWQKVAKDANDIITRLLAKGQTSELRLRAMVLKTRRGRRRGPMRSIGRRRSRGCATRSKGSRRITATRAGPSSDDPDEPEPAERRHDLLHVVDDVGRWRR